MEMIGQPYVLATPFSKKDPHKYTFSVRLGGLQSQFWQTEEEKSFAFARNLNYDSSVVQAVA